MAATMKAFGLTTPTHQRNERKRMCASFQKLWSLKRVETTRAEEFAYGFFSSNPDADRSTTVHGGARGDAKSQFRPSLLAQAPERPDDNHVRPIHGGRDGVV